MATARGTRPRDTTARKHRPLLPPPSAKVLQTSRSHFETEDPRRAGPNARAFSPERDSKARPDSFQDSRPRRDRIIEPEIVVALAVMDVAASSPLAQDAEIAAGSRSITVCVSDLRIQAPAAAAGALLAYLDARSLAALYAAGASTQGSVSRALLARARECIAQHARARVASALGPQPGGGDDASDPPPPLSTSRNGSCSWLEALDNVESWALMRTALSEEGPGSARGPAADTGSPDLSSVSVTLPASDALARACTRLRLKEDLSAYTFPYRSL